MTISTTINAVKLDLYELLIALDLANSKLDAIHERIAVDVDFLIEEAAIIASTIDNGEITTEHVDALFNKLLMGTATTMARSA